jgi:predicted O-methyltransferase YrrM
MMPPEEGVAQAQVTTLGDGLQYPIEAERSFMPNDVYDVGSMLSFEERLFLHHAGRTGIPGAIVDLGAFLGGSTLALASGAELRDATVHSFDLFRLADDWEREWIPEGFEIEIGESTLPIYEQNIRRVRDRVTVHEGDVANETWNEPIGVLFVDIAKSWDTADAVWNTFFPWLKPGALVIQQDLVHWGHPWCAIMMEHLADHFDYLGWTWMGTSVWRCKSTPRQIPPSMLKAFSCEEMLELIDRAAERVGGPAGQSIRLSGVKVLMAYGKRVPAEERVEEIRATLINDELPFIEEAFAVYDDWLR